MGKMNTWRAIIIDNIDLLSKEQEKELKKALTSLNIEWKNLTISREA